ncbi:MAG TPA: S-methyl-5'-thioadenosine phosphorylase [Dehalococcoidia bacterium]|nr:S-methyl-5'-thioadenosine phosphorylase [Dehalococcoidia bacterium]
MASTADIAVIGGSGFYDLEGLRDARPLEVDTPFGATSSPILVGELHGKRVAFIARHGEGHRILPAEVPSRANLWALKHLGVRRVLAVSAVGSLQQQYHPLDAVVPDQLLDRTRGRASTYFGDGVVAHIGFADPFCDETREALAAASEAAGVTTHRGGTLVVIEGPAFSTRAESRLYQSWGAAVIGMTALPEAKLAREAELCYASICYVTDYDVWHDQEEDVGVELVVENMRRNIQHARDTVSRTIAALPIEGACACGDALNGAVITAPDAVPPATRQRLAFMLDRYWGAQ